MTYEYDFIWSWSSWNENLEWKRIYPFTLFNSIHSLRIIDWFLNRVRFDCSFRLNIVFFLFTFFTILIVVFISIKTFMRWLTRNEFMELGSELWFECVKLIQEDLNSFGFLNWIFRIQTQSRDKSCELKLNQCLNIEVSDCQRVQCLESSDWVNNNRLSWILELINELTTVVIKLLSLLVCDSMIDLVTEHFGYRLQRWRWIHRRQCLLELFELSDYCVRIIKDQIGRLLTLRINHFRYNNMLNRQIVSLSCNRLNELWLLLSCFFLSHRLSNEIKQTRLFEFFIRNCAELSSRTTRNVCDVLNETFFMKAANDLMKVRDLIVVFRNSIQTSLFDNSGLIRHSEESHTRIDCCVNVVVIRQTIEFILTTTIQQFKIGQSVREEEMITQPWVMRSEIASQWVLTVCRKIKELLEFNNQWIDESCLIFRNAFDIEIHSTHRALCDFKCRSCLTRRCLNQLFGCLDILVVLPACLRKARDLKITVVSRHSRRVLSTQNVNLGWAPKRISILSFVSDSQSSTSCSKAWNIRVFMYSWISSNRACSRIMFRCMFVLELLHSLVITSNKCWLWLWDYSINMMCWRARYSMQRETVWKQIVFEKLIHVLIYHRRNVRMNQRHELLIGFKANMSLWLWGIEIRTKCLNSITNIFHDLWHRQVQLTHSSVFHDNGQNLIDCKSVAFELEVVDHESVRCRFIGFMLWDEFMNPLLRRRFRKVIVMTEFLNAIVWVVIDYNSVLRNEHFVLRLKWFVESEQLELHKLAFPTLKNL